MQFSARLKIDFGAGQPDHFDVEFSLRAHPEDGTPQVGLQAVRTMAGAVIDTAAKPYEDQIKAEALAFAQKKGLWPLGG